MTSPPDADEAPLEIVQFAAERPGPRLLVLGAVHGNETCGPEGIGRVLADLRTGRLTLRRGTVTFVPVANPKAFRQRTREGDRNLNRDLCERPIPVDNEDRLGNLLCPLLRAHDVLLDIHSFTGAGEPFVFTGPLDNDGPLEPFRQAAAEWAFAGCLGVQVAIHGWLDGFARFRELRAQLDVPPLPATEGIGTTEYMRFTGGMAVTLECGTHEDPAAVPVADRAIRAALAHLGLTDGPPPPMTVDTAIVVTDALVCDAEGDRIEGEWRTADPVPAGALVVRRANGQEVRLPADGFIVFPNRNARPGQLLCYLGEASDRAAS